ncbi:MAG TPA: cytochrome P450 [Myxococcota bacterium]|jgi:cholest-4-en-3-one 26-monooxygenase|nr:cytochrome P450 [Myxococcota bacterium]
MSPASLDLATLDIATPEHYERNGYPHPEWTYLRKHAPVFWYERSNVDPYWAITKHQDIIELGKQPELFLNAPRLAVFTNDLPLPEDNQARHLLNMDPPEHAKYRNVVSKRFTPRTVQAWAEKVRRITSEVLDAAAEKETGDFVADISAPITIRVIAEMLGVPRSDWALLFKWTNETIAPQDPEFMREGGVQETLEKSRMELFGYFHEMAMKRRAQPTDDIVSAVANGSVDGQPLAALELLSFYFLLVVAGNETTRNAMTGGMLAFLEHPGEWKKLRADASRLDDAIEECVRWTTPVIQFCRTAVKDCELRGQKIRAGQSVCLFYPSANRDEEVFEDPFAFRIDRHPNRHIAFGMGEHVCLGAHLARLELRATFAALRERLEACEAAGPAERVRSSFVGGIKRAPMRWRIAPARA